MKAKYTLLLNITITQNPLLARRAWFWHVASHIKSEIVDMSNRIRRNKIVLHNVPEGVEDEEGCTSFVQNLVKGTLGQLKSPTEPQDRNQLRIPDLD